MGVGVFFYLLVCIPGAGLVSVVLDRRFMRRRLTPHEHNTSPSEQSIDDGPVEHTLQLTELLTLQRQWTAMLASLQGSLNTATTLEAVEQSLLDAWKADLAHAGLVLMLGAPERWLLDHGGTTWGRPVCAHLVYPRVATEYIPEILELLNTPACENKQTILLHKQDAKLYGKLTKEFEQKGGMMLVPLRLLGKLFGFALIISDTLSQNGDSLRDSTTYAAMLGAMLTAWLRCVTPQLIPNQDDAPASFLLPAEILPAMRALESLQNDPAQAAETQPLLQSYADLVKARVSELSLLAERACQILRNHCHAEVTMLLLPRAAENPAYATVEALDTPQGAWSPMRERLGETIDHPLVKNAAHLQQWPDPFALHLERMTESRQFTEAYILKAMAPQFAQSGIQTLFIIPAPFYGECQAVFVIGGAQQEDFAALQAFVSTLSLLVAASLGFMGVEHELQAEKQLTRNLTQTSFQQMNQLVEALSYIAHSRSILLGTEPHKVAELAEAIAHRLELSQYDYRQIRVAALVCDIGMVSVPESIPRKKGKLSELELACLRMHPKFSVKILSEIAALEPILPLILHHHERWDGSGYPDQLAGEDIPIGSRIIAVADAYISMQNKRSYRDPMSADEAFAALVAGIGNQFDAQVVNALAELLGKDISQSVA